MKFGLLEHLINNFIFKFNQNNNGIFIRLEPKFINNKFVSHGYIDYIAYVNNNFLGFEAKQTSKEIYFKKHKITKGQILILEKLLKMNCHSFLVFYFEFYNQFIAIDYRKFKVIANKTNILIGDIIKLGIKIQTKDNYLDLMPILKL